jgi:beta-lactamase regulating signal transducer with metallopeptidase domain
MNPLTVSTAVVERLGWVLVHSLWEFLLIGIVAVSLSRVLRRSSAEIRYIMLLIAFSVMAVAPVATWLACPQPAPAENRETADVPDFAGDMRHVPHETASAVVSWPTPPVVESSTADQISIGNKQTPAVLWSAVQQVVKPRLNTIVAIWCCGVLAFAVRPLAGWSTVRHLRRVGVATVPANVQELLERTAKRLKLRKAIAVLQSTLVQVPLVVGYLRPAILLPVSVVTNLPALQLEAILAHELAHIRRHDYLVNLAQTLIETVFFYHPSVWWLSREIRNERENCCDDLAVALLGSRVEYGQALLSVEELRGTAAVLAVGAAGGSLVARIRRLLVVEPVRRNSSFSWSTGAAISSLALAFGVAATLSVFAAVKLPRDGAASDANDPRANRPAADSKDKSGDDSRGDKSLTLDIVIAEHVLLWDGRIVTWEQFVKGLQAIRRQTEKPVQPRFHVTKGAIEAGHWERYQVAVGDLGKELVEPADSSFRWMSQRASQRYDALRSQDDLAPKPEHARTGTVLDPSGRPQANATVVLIPEESATPVNLKDDLSLADPLDEIWTRTDRDGRFRIVAPYSEGLLVVFAALGSVQVPIPKQRETAEIKLLPRAEVQVSSLEKNRQEWSIQVFCPVVDKSRVSIDMVGLSMTKEPRVIRLPPGEVILSREVNMGQGIKQAEPAEKFELQAGARRQVVLRDADPQARPQPLILRHPANTNPAQFSEKAIRSLYKPTNIEWTELPLADGLQYLSEFHDLPLRSDEEALRAAKISPADIPVTLKLDGVSLRSALKLVLEPYQLGFYIDAKGIVVTTQEKAAEQSKARRAPGQSTSDKKDDAASPDKPKEQGAADDNLRSLNIVIAEHVLMWDGKIVTWEEVVEGLRAIRKEQGKPIHPSFKFTNGAIKVGRWNLYQAAAYDVYKELFEPAGMNIGSMSPRAGERYDKIRVPADLIPRPEDVRVGVVRNSAGRPVTVATVLLMPEDSAMPVMLRPNLSLRDTLDEVWVHTDKEGRFKIACPDTGYRLIVLSPAGFAQAPVPKAGEQAEIQLLPNCELQVSSTDKSTQELGISVHLPDMKEGHDGFSLYEIFVGEQPRTIRLPPGRVTLSRAAKIGKGATQLTPAQTFDLQPGEKTVASFRPPADEEDDDSE